MAKRVKVGKSNAGIYFEPEERKLKFITSGCTLLDCVLGGGWPLGRFANVVGDKSTGKTLLMIEACANFALKFPGRKIRYREAEAAFDEDYAQVLGLPGDSVDFGDEPIDTVEEFDEDLERYVEECGDQPGLYILDSLDALSDKAEKERDITDASYGASKPKKLGEMFRRRVRAVEKTKVCVLIVSQVRDNIGVTFGEKHTRSGGRALDFFASQIIWLANTAAITKTRSNIERMTGRWIRAKCKKNKVGPPFREIDFPIIFSYGVDDLLTSLVWMQKTKKYHPIFDSDAEIKKFISGINKLSDDQYRDLTEEVVPHVRRAWFEIEEQFKPARSKYKGLK